MLVRHPSRHQPSDLEFPGDDNELKESSSDRFGSGTETSCVFQTSGSMSIAAFEIGSQWCQEATFRSHGPVVAATDR
jgi:hypothetical protein